VNTSVVLLLVTIFAMRKLLQGQIKQTARTAQTEQNFLLIRHRTIRAEPKVPESWPAGGASLNVAGG
jgi:hypothetical protein